MNEELTNESGQQMSDNTDYIEAIKKMKESSVSREQYDKLKTENKQLLDSLVNGNTISTENVKPKTDIDKLRKELFTRDNHMTNLEYVSKALELRDAIIEEGGIDPFVPVGNRISPTTDDFTQAQRAADVFKECIEYADGNDEVFVDALSRRIR